MIRDGRPFTRREYLMLRVLEMADDTGILAMLLAEEAVASTALAHPEWDLDEKKTWAEWEANHD